jgi:choline dehydrogenase-like flavoprotein
MRLRESVSGGDDTIVVIGSGPPGAVASLLLAKAGVKVVLIDAGLPGAARGLTARIAGITVARLHRTLPARRDDLEITGDPRTVLYEDVSPGGLTNHWSCAVPRFSRDDFLDGRRAGVEYEWPIDYDDLAPWYDRVEPLLQIAGSPSDVSTLPAGKVAQVTAIGSTWQPVAAAAARQGQALLPVPYAFGLATTVTLSGTVFNSFVRLVKPAQRHSRLTVRLGCRVTRLEWSDIHQRIESVVLDDVRKGTTHKVRCRAVVLAAGAINTAKILLQSTHRDFPDGLGNRHGVLGRYLHDHPLGKLEIELDRPLHFMPAAYLTRQPLHQTEPLYAAACLQWSGVRMFASSVLRGHPSRLTVCGFNIFGTMAPIEANHVALRRSRTSAESAPGLVLNCRHPQESLTALVSARDRLLTLLDAARLRARIRHWNVDGVGSAVHFAGTCRMHASPRFGMLDGWNRLHAVPNVVVADSAAFTTGPEKNPVLTAMALAARATQRLMDDLRAGRA